MIEQLETPTFVVEDFYDVNHIRLFDYLNKEKIPFEILELCSADLPYREGAYYPIIIDDLTEDYDLFANINPRALEMAQKSKLILLFIYTGHKNISLILRGSLVEQMIENKLCIADLRIITSVKPITLIDPYVYFSFAEMEIYMEAHESDSLYVDGFCQTHREKVFTINVDEDTPHARLFCSSIWYHALAEYSYMNYPEQCDPKTIMDSSIYGWNQHWNATATLMDMFGQQLPIMNKAGCKLDYFNNAYWNFSVMPTFSLIDLSLSKAAFDPILNLQPFVIVGPPGSMKLLRTMGYRTFKSQVNESYDTLVDDESRMQNLFRLVYEMAHFTGEELHSLNNKLRKDLQHNQEHLLSSKKFKLLTLLNALEAKSH